MTDVTDQRPKPKKSCLPDGMEGPKKPLPPDPVWQKLMEKFKARLREGEQ